MEKVLVVAKKYISAYLQESGITAGRNDELLDIIKKRAQYIPRARAETDPEYRQIIPYVAVLREGSVFASKRLALSGEERLRGLVSIGFGGHINPCDSESDPLIDGLRRELREEISIELPGQLRFLGIINDETNDVGRVHLGMFYTLEAQGAVAVLETEKLEGMWIAVKSLPKHYERMESWSRLASPLLMAPPYTL